MTAYGPGMPRLRSVAVFCASSSGSNAAIEAATVALGRELAERRIRLVYGGGNSGLMGRVATTVMANGGEVLGVIPEHISTEVAHAEITELRVVGSMHERKAEMYAAADAVVALPGGFGTLEELAEALTWTQLGLHSMPVGLLDVDGYWSHLVEWMDRAVSDGLLKPKNRIACIDDADPTVLLDRLEATELHYEPKWDDR